MDLPTGSDSTAIIAPFPAQGVVGAYLRAERKPNSFIRPTLRYDMGNQRTPKENRKRYNSMNPNALGALALLLTSGEGHASVRNALSAAAQLETPLNELITWSAQRLQSQIPSAFDNAALALARCPEKNLSKAERLLERASKANAQTYLIGDGDYPRPIARSLGKAAPPLLFAVGNSDVLARPNAAVVGSRAATRRGLEIAESCAAVFARKQVPVASGGARGVDTVAHASALEYHGTTIVALPQGILTYRAPKELADALNRDAALLLSQFAPDQEWSAHGALARNATICALSKLVCVIEPKRKGGSIHTVRRALEQRKTVLGYWPRGGDRLENAGVLPLVDRQNKFDAHELLRQWRRVVNRDAGQEDLFT